jgi:raffinose/stachyose/melibiose transport system permease protein
MTSQPTTPTLLGDRARRHHRGGKERTAYALFLVPGTLLFLAVLVVPFVMNIGISLTRWEGIGPLHWIGIGNYRTLYHDSTFWLSFRNNLALVVAMAILPTVIGLVLAYALFDYIAQRFGPRTASVLRTCFYLPQILPVVVAGLVWSWILNADGGALNVLLGKVGLDSLAKDWLGDPKFALYTVMAVLVWVQIGFPLVVFMSGLQRIDPALYEAAELDGASWSRRFWHVTIPQMRPEVYVVLLWCTIAALKVFAPIYALTRGGPGGATNVPAYFAYQNFFEKTQVGYGAAVATVLTLLIVILLAVFLRMQSGSESEEY